MLNENFVVVDIETKDSFFSAGSPDPAALNISVVGVYASDEDKLFCLKENEIDQLWPYMEKADRIIGFNLKGFDYPILQKYYNGTIAKLPTLDMLEEFKKDHGFRIKLDILAQENLGHGKSGDGLMAIKLYEEGKIEELMQYCLDDIKITRDLFLQGRDSGVLYYPDRGKRTSWMVDWALKRDPKATALTLPF